MDRKEYWNKEYAAYWKKVTDDAEVKDGEDSGVKKLSGHDFKAPDIKVATDLFECIAYRKDDRLLDYGCGLGRFFPFFSDKCEYYGIDISQAMIDECIRSYPDVKDRFIVSEGEELPFEDGFFDRIICYGVFDACYQEQALQEMLRVCATDGVIVFSGKNDRYFPDDEEAYIAEVNARKKGHPNYFTDVRGMLEQLGGCSEILEKRFALRRGDLGKSIYIDEMPERFYEWQIILKKTKNHTEPFGSFSDAYSRTWKERGDSNQ